MITFDGIESPVTITKDFILSRLSDEQIFGYYFGSFSPGKTYCSVLRPDRNPSTSFFYNNSGKLTYFDHARQEAFDCFDFVQELYKIGFGDALKKIANDFGIVKDAFMGASMTYREKQDTSRIDKNVKREKIFQFTILPWEQRHLDIWTPFSFTKEELEADRFLYPIEELFINKKRIYNPGELPWFIYVIPDIASQGKYYFKAYMPSGGDMKWLTNNPNTNPYGYLDLPYKSSTLIITKSRKDMMVLRKIWPDVMAVQNESEGALLGSLLTDLKKRYDKIYIWFDADNTGVENCTKFNKYGCGYINTPKHLWLDEKFQIKDPAEFARQFTIEGLREYTYNKLNLWEEAALIAA
jgi:hypothetical protein